jgi:hypothetical protein
MEVQTVEQFLFEQLEKIAPGKYTLANVLQLFKSKLRFSCDHLKGGAHSRLRGPSKDYNLSIFTFSNDVTEIKCLYNCGLKIRSDEKELVSAFNELYDLPSTNSRASAEVRIRTKNGERIPIDPGPVPTYSDEHRRRLKESTDLFWEHINHGLSIGSIKPDNRILGAVLPHPDPIEAPDSIVERGIVDAFAQSKIKAVKKAIKTRKARKTQSRKRG